MSANNYLEITLPIVFDVIEITIHNELRVAMSTVYTVYDEKGFSWEFGELKVPLPTPIGRWEVKYHDDLDSKLILMDI